MLERADAVFVNGSVLTLGSGPPIRTCVAVRDGRVVRVAEDVSDLTGRSTEVHDLAGGLLSPAFLDAHVHPVFAGLELITCDLSHASTVEDYLDLVTRYAASHPGGGWITGGGWSMPAFPSGKPHRATLDAVVPDRPVYLPNRDHHGSWVNTRALEIAGIDARTPDPSDGRIERDAGGVPTGLLHEGAADLVTRHIPTVTDAEVDAAFDAAQRVMHGFGITGWQDAIVGSYLGRADPFDAYVRAERSGRLTARVTGALWWDRGRGLEQLDGHVERRRATAGGRFRASAVKIMQDGVAETFAAAMLSPFLDPCGHRDLGSGESFFDPVVLTRDVSALVQAGFDLHFHALGDRAVRECLDALESAARGRSRGRHQLAHLQVVHPDDVARFAALGATATIQPLWACHDAQMDELTLPFLGPERSAWQYPFASLHRSGARLAAGSDWPVSSPDPLLGIAVAVTRQPPGEAAEVFYPAERLTLRQAWDAYTVGTAEVNGWDDAGRIEVGAAADLVVLDHNPFAVPDAIADARVVGTWAGGVRVAGT